MASRGAWGGVALGPCAAAMAAGAELLPGPFPSTPGWFWVRLTMPEQSEARDGARNFKLSAYIIKHALAPPESSHALVSWDREGVGEECVTPVPSCSQ